MMSNNPMILNFLKISAMYLQLTEKYNYDVTKLEKSTDVNRDPGNSDKVITLYG